MRKYRPCSARLLLVIVMLVSLAHVACDNEEVIEARVSPQLPSGFVKLRATVFSATNSGEFVPGHTTASLDCAVTVVGTVQGKPVTRSFNVRLSASGPPGASYDLDCTDPLILQLPSDATNFAATMSAAAGPVYQLEVESGLSQVLIGPRGTDAISAESGQQIVVFSIPSGVSDNIYEISLSFDLQTIRPIDLKPIFAGRVVCDDQTLLPPLLPQVTSFTAVPTVTIPVSDTLVPILLPLDSLGDSEASVSCFGDSPIELPTLRPSGLIVLGTLVLLCGLFTLLLRRHP